MSSLLYSTHSYDDVLNILSYIDAFAETLEMEFLIDTQIVESIVSGMNYDFPHKDGCENASPFKKVANFATYFIAERPIKSLFPDSYSINGTSLNQIKNHQNAILAYHIAVDCLHNATIERDNDKTYLKNRIIVSRHTYIDIVECLAMATPQSHFKSTSILFEQLAYRSNPEASYSLEI